MTKREYDQLIHDEVLELIRERDEEAARTPPPPAPVVKKKSYFKKFLEKVLRYFTT